MVAAVTRYVLYNDLNSYLHSNKGGFIKRDDIILYGLVLSPTVQKDFNGHVPTKWTRNNDASR